MIRILLIDDHASTREPLAFMLNRHPEISVVAQAGSIAEAREALQRHGEEVDLAIIDLGLPDGSGEELIHDLHAANRDAAALVLTYFSDRERLAQAVTAGAAGVLHKSATIQEVVDAVQRLGAGEQLITLEEVVAAFRLVDAERRKDDESKRSFSTLTEREIEVLQALTDGLGDKEIAERLFISAATVRTHVSSILSKLNAHSRLQALVAAVRQEIVSIS
jgi:DNA-binding NarL/FixJ family response regulator